MNKVVIAGLSAAGALGLWLGYVAPAEPQTGATVASDVLLADSPAKQLSDYRLFDDASARQPASGVTPYVLNTPLFSDYAEKFRYIYVPPGERIPYSAEGVLDLPVGAVLIKTFAFPPDLRKPDENIRFIETRLLIHKASGWVALTYIWNDAQTEAVLKRTGTTVPIDTIGADGAPLHINYAIPNVNQCKECHSASGVVMPIGPKARNLNGNYAYASGTENQLKHWSDIGILAGAPDPASAPSTPRWDDPSVPLADRAKAYLDANCAHCHTRTGMASTSGLFLELDQPDKAHRGIGKVPIAAGRGSGQFHYDIVPGDPDQSILLFRMESTEPGVMMPELARTLVHKEGVALIRDYIAAMDPNAP